MFHALAILGGILFLVAIMFAAIWPRPGPAERLPPKGTPPPPPAPACDHVLDLKAGALAYLEESEPTPPLQTLTAAPGGLYLRYVLRRADGSDVAEDGAYFVLNLNSKDAVHGRASRLAATAYSDAIAAWNPELAAMLYDQVLTIRKQRKQRAEEA
jgi:hypothetical protein